MLILLVYLERQYWIMVLHSGINKSEFPRIMNEPDFLPDEDYNIIGRNQKENEGDVRWLCEMETREVS